MKTTTSVPLTSFNWPEFLNPGRPTTVDDCPVVQLSKIHNDRSGNLTVVEPEQNFPFNVKRVFYLYDVPGGVARGGHAHRNLYQFLVAASGSFEVLLDDGQRRRSVFLNRPDVGLLILPTIWGELQEFSSGAICLALASDIYLESDYLRNYEEFLKFTAAKYQG